MLGFGVGICHDGGAQEQHQIANHEAESCPNRDYVRVMLGLYWDNRK